MATPAEPFRVPVAGRSGDILAVFTRAVAEKGYAGANFGDIAAELGISKGTIVHHYGTKDRLFAAMLQRYMERRLTEAKALIAEFDSPAEQLSALLYAFMLYQVIERDSTIAFQRETATLATNPALAEGRRLRAEYLETFRSIFRAGIDEGAFLPIDVDVTSLLVFGSSQWAWTWFRPEGGLSAVSVGADLIRAFLGGILTDRSALDRLADPKGIVASTAQRILAA